MGSSLIGLLAEEEEALAGLGSPSSDVVRNIGGLVSLEGADGLEIDGLASEPKELLGEKEVPSGDSVSFATLFVRGAPGVILLGEVGGLALVLKVTLLNGLDFLLLLLGLLASSGGGLGLGSLSSGGGSGRGLGVSDNNGGLSDGNNLEGLDLGRDVGSGDGRLSLLGELNVLLLVGHFEYGEIGYWVSGKKDEKRQRGIGYH